MANIRVNEIITNRFIDALNEGIIPWEKGWINGSVLTGNYVTKKEYSLLNKMLLSHPGLHLSFKQMQEKHAEIVKECPVTLLGKEIGKKDPYIMTQEKWESLNESAKFALLSDIITFYKVDEKDSGKKDDDGNPIMEKRFTLRYYRVIWEGYTNLYKPVAPVNTEPRIKSCDALMKYYSNREGVRYIEEDGSEAFYTPASDEIHLPSASRFKHMEEFYSTAFHETTHSTGNKKRLDRDMSGGFGSKSYAREELVAEIGASFLTNHFGIRTDKVERNNIAYVQNWIQRLQKDPDLIIKASQKAQKAMDFILDGFEEPKEDPKPSKPVKSKRYLLGYFNTDEIIAKQFDGYDVEYDNTTYFVHKSPKGTCWQVSCPRTGRLLANRLVTGWNTRKEAIEAIPDIHPTYIKVLAKGVAEHEASFKKCVRKAEEQ